VVADISNDLPRPRSTMTRSLPEFTRLASELRVHINH